MPFYELNQTIHGRSSLERWKLVLRQFSISLLILAGAQVTFFLALEYFGIDTPTLLITLLFGSVLLATIIFVIAPFLISWSVVFLVVIGIRIWAFVKKVRSGTEEESDHYL